MSFRTLQNGRGPVAVEDSLLHQRKCLKLRLMLSGAERNADERWGASVSGRHVTLLDVKNKPSIRLGDLIRLLIELLSL